MDWPRAGSVLSIRDLSSEASCIVLPTDLTSCIERGQRILSQPQLSLLLSLSNHSCLLLQVPSRFSPAFGSAQTNHCPSTPKCFLFPRRNCESVPSAERGTDPLRFKAKAVHSGPISLSIRNTFHGFVESVDGADHPRPNRCHCTSHQPCPSCWTITHADNRSRDQNRTEKCNLPHAVSQAVSVSDLQVRLPGLRSG